MIPNMCRTVEHIAQNWERDDEPSNFGCVLTVYHITYKL